MLKTKTFSRERMRDILYGCEENEVIKNQICGTSRWTINFELVFSHEGKFYRTYYSKGSTEYQDERPWEYEKEVKCTEVHPVEKTVIEYEDVNG